MNLASIITTIFLSLFLACGNLNEVLESVETIGTSTEDLTPSSEEMGMGLKDALIKGTQMGVEQLNKSGGYLNDPEVKIPFPKDLEKVKNTLIDMGLQSEVDKVVSSLNAAAEDAVIEAKPLFVKAIKEMSIADAKEILFGADTAATSYLKSKTRLGLHDAFKPKIKTSLDKVNEDLPAYVTDLAIQGLFLQIAKEEAAIRENPLERTTDILKKVFGYADQEK